jgi:hypothetical protein
MEIRREGSERNLPPAGVKENGAPQADCPEARMSAERTGVESRNPATGPRNIMMLQKMVCLVPQTKEGESKA